MNPLGKIEQKIIEQKDKKHSFARTVDQENK